MRNQSSSGSLTHPSSLLNIAWWRQVSRFYARICSEVILSSLFIFTSSYVLFDTSGTIIPGGSPCLCLGLYTSSNQLGHSHGVVSGSDLSSRDVFTGTPLAAIPPSAFDGSATYAWVTSLVSILVKNDDVSTDAFSHSSRSRAVGAMGSLRSL